MFEIKYRILQDFEYLSNVSVKIFDKENDEIYGFIELRFNNEETGFYLSEEEFPYQKAVEENVFMHDELLCWWFKNFLEVIIRLKTNSVTSMKYLESFDTYFIFKKEKDKLEVRCGTIETKMGYSATDDKKEVDELEWSEVISYDQFVDEVLSKCEMFMSEVIDINKKLKKVRIMKNLQKLIKEVKKSEGKKKFILFLIDEFKKMYLLRCV